jgi:spore germination cell wall hydrolase CwlJ-like protein
LFYEHFTCLDRFKVGSTKKILNTKIVKTNTAQAPKIVKETKTYSDIDLEYLACVIYTEHGGNAATDEERMLDGYVVLNRVKSKLFPNTIKEVLEQEGQYAGFENGVIWPERSKNNGEKEAVARAYKIAKYVLENKSEAPDNVVYQAEFEQGSGVYKHINNTYYCYI